MAITDHDVARIANLARIALSAQDAERTQRELNGILDLIEQLQAVDTRGVEPLAHPLSAHEDIHLRLREDKAAPGTEAQRASLMANAPATAEGLFLVPTVIE